MGNMKKCLKFATELKDGEKVCSILRNDVKIAEGIPEKDLEKYIENLEKEAKKVGKTLDDHLDELADVTKIDDAIKELDIEIKVPKNRLSAEASLRRMESVVNDLKNGSKRFNPEKKKLKELGITLKRSKKGLSVDFEGTRYLYQTTGKQKNIVKIKLTGVDGSDFKLANKLAGLKKKPTGYTWHHLDDYDPITGTCTVQLVDSEIHVASLPHYGGVKVLEEFLNFKYLSRP
ncbi:MULTISPECIES: HNH endonuclease [unclassified Chryseobacterium]|uniref:HNH endonuclease signature motif containing protein n=1 Tax=unclassified Chryseobacterium TaxID=2593645 RepID=UPI000D56F266|nr:MULTISPECIES: HNH endonuclease [unclassified Chryseobacterium]PVV50992.1 hypothetical protein DD829_20535 [Chryseobacterium sp. HMWF035]